MRNILLISMLCGSFTVLAGDAVFTDFKPGFWAGEATYYHGGVCQEFFFAGKVSHDGKSFISLIPPRTDQQYMYQRYILNQEGNLEYALRFGGKMIIEGELRLQENAANDANVQIFVGEKKIHGQVGQVRLKFTSINDTQMEITAYFKGEIHGQLILHWQGDKPWSEMWVGKSMMAYNLSYHWKSLQKALTFGYHSEL